MGYVQRYIAGAIGPSFNRRTPGEIGNGNRLTPITRERLRIICFTVWVGYDGWRYLELVPNRTRIGPHDEHHTSKVCGR